MPCGHVRTSERYDFARVPELDPDDYRHAVFTHITGGTHRLCSMRFYDFYELIMV